MGTFTQKYINLIKEAKTDEDLADVINAIYEDGFDDGASEGAKCDEMEPDVS